MTPPKRSTTACVVAERILAHLRACGHATPGAIRDAMGPNVTQDEIHDALTLLVGRCELVASSKDGHLVYSARAKA